MLKSCQSKYTTLFPPEKIFRQQTIFNNADGFEDDSDQTSTTRVVSSERKTLKSSCLHPFEVGSCSKAVYRADTSERVFFSVSSTKLREKKIHMLIDHDHEKSLLMTTSLNGTTTTNVPFHKFRDAEIFNPIVKGTQFTSSISQRVLRNNQEQSPKLPTVTNHNVNTNKKRNDMLNSQTKSSIKLRNKIAKFVEGKCSSGNVKNKININNLFHKSRNSVSTLYQNQNSLCNENSTNCSNDYSKNINETKNIDNYDINNNINYKNSNYSLNDDERICLQNSPRKASKTRNKKNVLSVSPCKRKKIFYSEKQSQMKNGAPAVPPCTPAYVQYDSVKSMADLKSQRSVIQKLIKLESRQQEKEKDVLKRAKELAEKRKAEELEELIQKQRRQIYFLNDAMTKYENEKFLEFKLLQSGAPV